MFGLGWIFEMKKLTIPKAKKKAWEQFSIYIRLKYANSSGIVQCVTCGIRKHYKDNMQAGHFIPGRGNAVLYDERLVYPQCFGCNYGKSGNYIPYERFMLTKHTKKEIEGFKDLFYTKKDMSLMDHLAVYEKYKSLNKKN